MNKQIIREPARVLFHLNGYTKILLERTEGKGLADGGIMWDISTEIIPRHLRRIGTRFIIQCRPADDKLNDDNATRNPSQRIEILELP